MPHPHIHSPSYASPVLRAPSPASSLGTSYAPDATSFSDTEAELSQSAFERKWEDRLRLGREFAREWNGDLGEGEDEEDEEEWDGMRGVRDREREGWGREPLIQGERTPAEDKYIHEQILRSLRYQIHLLEENDLFEQTLLTRGGPSQAALSLDHQPTTNDIDTLMRSMMSLGGPGNNHSHNSNRDRSVGHMSANMTAMASAGTITNGPWNRGAGMEGVADVTSTPGRIRGTAKGKGKSRR